MIDRTEFHDRVRACLYGVAIGDALGVPVENMSAKAIRKATDDKGVTRYVDSLQTTIKDTMRLKAGDVSDDTQTALAVVTSLVRMGGFDLPDQGRALVQALFGTDRPEELRRRVACYDESKGERIDPNPSGKCSWIGSGMRWGGTIEGSTVEMARFLATTGKEGRNPERAAMPPPPDPETEDPTDKPAKRKRKTATGLGTGPSMKIAGLAVAYRSAISVGIKPYAMDCSADLMRHAWSSAKQTHHDARAAHASIGIGAAIGTMLILPRDLDPALTREIVKLRVRSAVRTREHMDRHATDFRPHFGGENAVSARIEHAFAELDSVERLQKATGSGFSSLEAIPFALGVAIRNADNFERGVLEAVNAGGDTDTIASMVGAIIGARAGMATIPLHLVNGLRKGVRHDIEELAPKLAALSLKIRPL